MLCVYNHSADGSDPCAVSAADLTLAGAAKVGGAGAGAGGAGAGAGGPADSAAGSGAAAGGQRQQQVGSGLDEGHPATVVPPIGGRLVVMDSRLLHEVLPADAERYAIAVWFSKTPPGGAGAAGEQEAAAPAPAPRAVGSAAGAAAESSAQQAPAAAPAVVALPAAVQPLDGSCITAPGCIFVSVPAYRDSETQWTLADLFAKAEHPERASLHGLGLADKPFCVRLLNASC